MAAGWRVGDGWDYYSNESRYRSDRVIDERDADGTRYFLIEESAGIIGSAPTQRIRAWIDATDWTRENVTYVGGTLATNFTPGMPERFFHNGTFAYDQTDANRGTTTRWALVVNAFYSGPQTVALPWGSTLAGRMEYRALRTAADGTVARELTIRYPSADYANDLQYQLATGEIFKLVAARVGDRTRGVMIGG